jgi:hypothetical protein
MSYWFKVSGEPMNDDEILQVKLAETRGAHYRSLGDEEQAEEAALDALEVYGYTRDEVRRVPDREVRR